MGAQVPHVTAFGETAALYALMEGDHEEAKRVCAAMNRSERLDFVRRLAGLTKILDDLNAVRCRHCGQRIGKVPASAIRGNPFAIYWTHDHNYASACSEGGTMAEPVDLEQ